MSTRCNICVVLKDEDLGKELKFDVSKIGKKYADKHINKVGTVTSNVKYLSIYNHSDGYYEGVGRTLLNEFNTYDKALNLVLGGDASVIIGEKVFQYCAWLGESWEDCKPEKSFSEPECKNVYLYKFEDGNWYVKHYLDKGWHLLSDVLKETCEVG